MADTVMPSPKGIIIRFFRSAMSEDRFAHTDSLVWEDPRHHFGRAPEFWLPETVFLQ